VVGRLFPWYSCNKCHKLPWNLNMSWTVHEHSFLFMNMFTKKKDVRKIWTCSWPVHEDVNKGFSPTCSWTKIWIEITDSLLFLRLCSPPRLRVESP
jgi:hypothetical protein